MLSVELKMVDTITRNQLGDEIKNGFENASPAQSSHSEEEQQYLTVIRDLIADLESGRKKLRMDRTGVGTVATFMRHFRYSLRDGSFPLFTSKRVFWRGVVEELLWFVRGSTNAKELSDKKVTIWDENASRSFLDRCGLHSREEGDLGPVYGFQWRHFGAEYKDMRTDYTGLGVDQLKQVIEQIKTNPTSRRLLVSAWNPQDLPLMALPPCHVLFQFFIEDGELSLSMYQRSADLGLGVPFNVASYSLLLLMVANVCGLKPGDMVHTTADTHVYASHVEALKIQVDRTPRAFPTVRLKRQLENIEDFTTDDFELLNYNPHPAIKMPMAV